MRCRGRSCGTASGLAVLVRLAGAGVAAEITHVGPVAFADDAVAAFAPRGHAAGHAAPHLPHSQTPGRQVRHRCSHG